MTAWELSVKTAQRKSSIQADIRAKQKELEAEVEAKASKTKAELALLGTIEMNNIVALELQNPNLWEFYFQNDLTKKYYVQSCSLPFLSFETTTRKLGTKHYSAMKSTEDFSITFLETIDFKILNYLENWMNDIYDFNKKVFKIGDQTKTGLLTFQKNWKSGDPKNWISDDVFENIKSRTYKFEKMQLKSIATIDLTYNSSEPLIITATFIADKIAIM